MGSQEVSKWTVLDHDYLHLKVEYNPSELVAHTCERLANPISKGKKAFSSESAHIGDSVNAAQTRSDSEDICSNSDGVGSIYIVFWKPEKRRKSSSWPREPFHHL